MRQEWRSYPKEPRLEHPHLLLMARNQPRPCLLGVPGVCPTRGMITVLTSCCACHGNGAMFNKGMQMKAHDFFTVWGCARCHTWLDSSYIASREERQERFLMTVPLQIVEWYRISCDPCSSRKDREAAEWALMHISQYGFKVPAHG